MHSPPQTPSSSPQDDLDSLLIAQMREDFISESREILDRLGPLLVELEKQVNPDAINAIFRDVHTLKGTAGFVGLVSIQKLAHNMEDVFDALRDESLAMTPEIIDVAFDSLNALDVMQQDVAKGGHGKMDIDVLVGRLDAAQQSESVPFPSEKIAQNPGESDTAISTASSTVRVDVKLLDRLIALVGEQITARNALQASAERLEDEDNLEITAVIDRLTQQIQSLVTQMRLIPVERLFNRFIPVVRNMTREREMVVNFQIEGSETPFDRTIFEQMYDPLIHLLRNAIDHGLESPQIREKLGKPPQGTILLSAERRGEDVIVKVSDDGRGIDHQAVRQKAIERGLLNLEQAADLTEDQAIRLVFSAGFSTADQVTETSGRGVGLDVVVKNVRSLRGSIDIDTEPGRGTTFMIRLPITLAILQVMQVRSGEYSYALPLSIVRETLQLSPDQVHSMQQGKVVFIRDVALPLRSLATWLQHKDGEKPIVAHNQPAVVVRLARGEEVLLVDELIGRQQVVIQPLSADLGDIRGVDGSAILPDGRVTLILAVEVLAHI